MLKNSTKKIVLSLSIALHLFSVSIVHSCPRLSEYSFTSASVLPFCFYEEEKYVILGREIGGRSRGKYDDFGGGRERREYHPLFTAAREFFEEAILLLTLGLTLEEIRRYIDPNGPSHTTVVIAHDDNVTYVTNFKRYTHKLLKNFYRACAQTTDTHSQEKDRIALVQWKALKELIQDNPSNIDLQIAALEVDPITTQLVPTIIRLRTSFVRKLRPFFMHKPYTSGINKKIRFYE